MLVLALVVMFCFLWAESFVVIESASISRKPEVLLRLGKDSAISAFVKLPESVGVIDPTHKPQVKIASAIQYWTEPWVIRRSDCGTELDLIGRQQKRWSEVSAVGDVRDSWRWTNNEAHETTKNASWSSTKVPHANRIGEARQLAGIPAAIRVRNDSERDDIFVLDRYVRALYLSSSGELVPVNEGRNTGEQQQAERELRDGFVKKLIYVAFKIALCWWGVYVGVTGGKPLRRASGWIAIFAALSSPAWP